MKKRPVTFGEWQAAKSRAAGHKVGVSRRDLLAHGFWSYAALSMVPSLPVLLAKKAFAAGCDDVGADLPPAFIVFDMAGGAALAGNCLVGKKGGPKDYLKKYDTLGWNPKASGALDERFGLPMSAKYSKLFQGMTTRMSAAAQAGLRLGSVCHFSQLDTTSNRQNIASLVSAAGLRGSQVTKGFANIASNSGGNSDTVSNDLTLKPIFVQSVNDMLGSAKIGGDALKGLSKDQLVELATRSRDLSLAQREAIRSAEGGEMLYELTKCVYEKNIGYAAGASQLDPRQDTKVQTIFGINAGTQPTDMNAVAAGIFCNTINQLTGPAVWTLGDCDYHTGEQTKGDAQDLIMGEMIGRAVEYASQVKRPLFFQLITDGSCGSNPGTREWSQDTNEGVTIFGYYSPTAAPEYATASMQIGGFTDGQTADRDTLVGNDPAKAAYAVFANYCNIAGKMDRFNELVPNLFSADDLKTVLVFKGKV